MTFVSVLAVFGSNGTENKSDKFQKLFYDGLITALGSYASDVDAIVATSSPITALKETEKYGTALIQKLSSGAPLRALFQPELQQFQAVFDEAVAEAVETAGSGIAVVIVVYAGEVLHSTGEWLLADSTFSGEQMQMWLDSEAASAWQPEIQKLTSAPTGTEPISIVICTPSAGAKTRWPMAATPDGSTKLTMLSKSRRLPVRLHITASWRINGKLASSANNNATSYEALQALSGDLARLHWENQSKLLVEAEKQEYSLAQRSFKNAPPALYVLPSGPGGVQTQACGLFVVQGVNILLGSAFTDKQPPQWWPLVRSLDSLDTVIIPDWSAASIQSYNFLIKHLLSSTSSASGASWLGWVFAPATVEPGSESPLLLAPPSTNPDPSRIHALSTTSDHRTRLFYKIGVGELTLHWLGAAVGALLIWQPFGSNKKSPGPLTVFLPVTQPPEGGSATTNNSPATLLAGMVRMLRKVPEICKTEVSEAKAPSTTTATALTNIAPKKMGVAASKAPAPSKPTAMRNGTVPSTKTQVNGNTKNTATAATKPAHTAAKPLPTKSAASSLRPATATRTTTVPMSRPATGTIKPSTTSTAASKPSSTTSRTALSRPATASAHKPAAARPTPRAPTKPMAATKATAPTKKSPISKTEAKLTEHAAKVAAKTAGSTAASKPGHEIMYAPAGRPSNLPPRRKVGEKTVMEELNELPEEVIKSPSIVDSLAAEPMKEEAIGSHEESEGQVSYPDSLRADEERHEATTKSLEMEPMSNGVEQQKVEEHVHTEKPLKVSTDILETFEMTKSPEMEFGLKETDEVPLKPQEHEDHEALNSPEVALSKSPAQTDFNMPPFSHEEAENVSKSPLEIPQEELISKISADVDYAIPPVHHTEVEMQQQQETSSEMNFGMKSPEDIHEVETLKSPFAEMQFAVPPGHPDDVEQLKSSKIEIPHEQQYSEGLSSPKTQPHEEIVNSSTEMAFSSPPGPPKEVGHQESPEEVLHQEGLPKFPMEDEFSIPPGAINHHMVIETSKLPVEQFHEELSQEHLDDFHTSKSPVEHHEVTSMEQTYESQFHSELSKSPASADFMLHEHQDEFQFSKSPVEHDDISQKQQTNQPQFTEEPSESPAAMVFTMPLAHNNDSHIPESPVEHLEISKTEDTPVQQIPEELSNSTACMDFSMPPAQIDDFHMSRSPVEQHVIPQTEQTSEQQIHEELPKSPTGMDFSSPHEYHDELVMSDTPVEQHEIAQKEQTPEPEFQEERSKSPAGMDLALSSSHQGDFITSKSPSEQHESLLMSQSPDAECQLHLELPTSPATNAEHQDNFYMSKSPNERYEMEPLHEGPSESLDKMDLSPNQLHPEFPVSMPPQEELGESNSSFHEELSKSPSLGVEQHEEHHEKLGLSNSPFDNAHQSSELTNPFPQEPCNFEMPQGDIPTDPFGSLKTSDNPFELSKSPAEVQFVVSPDVEAHKDLESVHSPVGGVEIIGHHQIDTSATSDSYGSDIDSRPHMDYHIHHSGGGMQFGDFGSSPNQQNPASTTAEDEYPVHEVNMGGGKAIPEVSEHVDSTEAAIHSEDPYQLHSSQCTAQLADSTTTEVAPNSGHAHPPEIGFMDLESLGKAQEENIHSPSSEVSNDSVIHTGIGGKPFPPGFIPETVSSTSPQAHTGGSSTVSPTSGFTSEHPFLYKDQQEEGLEHDLNAMPDATLIQKFSSTRTSRPGTSTSSRTSTLEREAVSKLGGGRGVESITVVPTDEPLEWVRWLRRSAGGSGNTGTGEERLQAAGLTVHTSATLCDIHFSDNSSEITCPAKPTSPNGTNGMTETNGTSEKSAESNVVGGATVEDNSAGFDPLMHWGQPQGMPAPISTARGPTALGTKTSTNGPASMALKAPENLKPGPPILIDVVWVPGYIIRVPFAMATQFFTHVRARVYVLSGECLHPITGEALIAGISKWTPEG
nr:microtubule associated protein 1S [Hymenolepis microstoma]